MSSPSRSITSLDRTVAASHDSLAQRDEVLNEIVSVKPPPTPMTAPVLTGAAGSTPFRARPAPITKPTIQPRLSKAAALRMGIAYQPASFSPHRAGAVSPSKAGPGFGISGLPRTDVKTPASLRAPTIAPRLNKTAAVRTGGIHTTPTVGSELRTTVPPQKKPVDFSNTPGHKRFSSMSAVSSTTAPSIVPRQNRASLSRMQHLSSTANGGAAASMASLSSRPGSSAASFRPAQTTPRPLSAITTSTTPRDSTAPRKQVDYANTPGHKRHSLSLNQIAALKPPTVLPRQNRASLARVGAPLTIDKENIATPNHPTPPTIAKNPANTPGHKRQSLNISVASLKTPLIQPRLNKAADARLSMGAAAPPSSIATSGITTPGSGTQTKILGPIARRPNQPPPSSFRASRV